MGDSENALTSNNDLVTWERLLSEQTTLFQRTAARNAHLEARLDELERELSVWKAALKATDEDKKKSNETISKLERTLGALRDDNPLILCLIDGDGNIFSGDLWSMGQPGGRHAAMLLTKGITEHLMTTSSSDASTSVRGQLWLTIYCNKAGLLETLINNNVCNTEQFEGFMLGFNQASPLFSIVDVGNGKEAADTKIKECLRVFARFPQTSKVFFGGAHDNGYASTLTYLQNEGLADKIKLLRGYKDLAYEIKGLKLPYLYIEGLFMSKRLPAHQSSSKKATSPDTETSSIQPHDFDKFRMKSSTPTSRGSSTPPKQLRALDPDQPLYKQRPPPCNFYYLAECKQGSNCRFAHDYVLSPAQLAELRTTARKWPCPAVNRGQQCHLGENCIMGHACPRGAQCSFAKQGKCKFLAKGAHGEVQQGPHVRSQQTATSSLTADFRGPSSSMSPVQFGYFPGSSQNRNFPYGRRSKRDG